MRGVLLVLLAALCLEGCARDMGGWFEPAMKRTPRLGPASPFTRPFVEMNDATADYNFTKDISKSIEAGAWRWCGKAPTLRLQLTRTDHQRFVADFDIPETGFAQTGPVQVEITINGHVLTTVACDKPGHRHVEMPVAADWLTTQADNTVVLTVDKTWRSPDAPEDYGLILTRAGFRS